MSFNTYKSLSTVVKEFQIFYTEANFIVESQYNVNEHFRMDLELVLRKGMVRNSEAAICENLIYPILKEIWKGYVDEFIVWSHQLLYYDEKLAGVPDYIVAKRSPLGKIIFDQPYFIVVEAKKDNFDEGWGQCLAELVAVQKLNQHSENIVYGVVSNGDNWEFGQLQGTELTKNIKVYSIQFLEPLFGALNFIFMQCQQQVAKTSSQQSKA